MTTCLALYLKESYTSHVKVYPFDVVVTMDVGEITLGLPPGGRE